MAAVGEGTHAVFAPAFGWAPLVSSIARIPAGWAHMPLPIWAFPANPARRATSTLRSSYACSQTLAFSSSLRITGPASKSVWISSPVRSRNPVLTKMTRSAARAMHASRLTDVRRSSSMIPILIVVGGSSSASSTAVNRSTDRPTSSGPCIFGLTTYRLPLRELE